LNLEPETCERLPGIQSIGVNEGICEAMYSERIRGKGRFSYWPRGAILLSWCGRPEPRKLPVFSVRAKSSELFINQAPEPCDARNRCVNCH